MGESRRDLLAGKRLLFLIGAPRSGTTWLQLMLASAPEIASANETHLFSNYMPQLFRGWDRFRKTSRDIGLHHLITEEQYFSFVRDFASQALAAIAARKPGATVILEKTPHNALVWRDIARVFPNAMFLHLVRDPRAVVASLRAARHEWARGSWIPHTITRQCELWSKHVTSATQAKTTGHYHEVRYEDLREPATLGRIFSFVGVHRTDRECRTIIENYTIDKLRKNAVVSPWALSREPQKFFRHGEVDGWRRELTPGVIAAIEASLGKLMTAHGYEIQQRRAVRQHLSMRFIQSSDHARKFLHRWTQALADRL